MEHPVLRSTNLTVWALTAKATHSLDFTGLRRVVEKIFFLGDAVAGVNGYSFTIGEQMKHFQIDDSGHQYAIRVEEVVELGSDLVRTLIEIDLQTFAESTFSNYTAAAFLRYGHVFLLRADEGVIGTCVCMRTWDRPNETLILSMGIKPGWRGRGLGQFFISGVIERLRLLGHLAVCLLVGSGNGRALKVYKDVGFEVIDEGPLDPRTGECFVYMRLALPRDGKLVSIQGGGEAS